MLLTAPSWMRIATRAIFVTINYADGQRERIAADYLTLTGESANQKARERFADVPAAHANHKAVLWAAPSEAD